MVLGGFAADHVLAEDARAGVRAAQDLKAERERSDRRERWDLARGLVKAGAYKREDVIVDDIDAEGTRKAVALTPMFAEMKIDTLRGLAKTKLANAGPRRSPFEPDRKAANQQAATGGITLGDAMRDPVVIAAAARANALPIEKIAAAHLVTLAQTRAQQNGAAQ